MPLYDCEVTVWIKVYGDDEQEAKDNLKTTREWVDWDLMDVTSIKEVGSD
jgi:hypothetical protein